MLAWVNVMAIFEPRVDTIIQSEVSEKEKNKYNVLTHICRIKDILVAQTVKNPPAMQEAQVQSWC